MVAFRSKHALPAKLPAERENARLNCLNKLGILNTRNDPSIDNLVECTASFFNVPMALATLIDRDRQVFKSRYGIVGDGSERAVSFCQYTIRQTGVFRVDDTWRHPVLRHYPAVQDYPNVRYYAGSPIMIQGEHAIGALCILDREPHAVSSGRLDWLKHFASMLSHIIELNYAAQDEKLVRSLIQASARMGRV